MPELEGVFVFVPAGEMNLCALILNRRCRDGSGVKQDKTVMPREHAQMPSWDAPMLSSLWEKDITDTLMGRLYTFLSLGEFLTPLCPYVRSGLLIYPGHRKNLDLVKIALCFDACRAFSLATDQLMTADILTHVSVLHRLRSTPTSWSCVLHLRWCGFAQRNL